LPEFRADAKRDGFLKFHLDEPFAGKAAARHVDHDKRRFSRMYLTVV
jgi:hypothetical protein